MSNVHNSPARSSPATAFLDRLSQLGFEQETGVGRVICKGNPGGRATEISMTRVSLSNHAGDGLDKRSNLGFRLSVFTHTSLSVWLYFVPERFARKTWVRWLYRIKRWSVVGIPDPDLSGFRAVAGDTEWTMRFMLDGEAMDAVQVLLTEKRRPGPEPSVHFDPQQVHYGSPILQTPDLDPAWVEQLIGRLHKLADRVERLPAPTRPARLNRLQRFGRKHPVLLGLLIVVGVMTGMVAIVMALVALVVILA